MNRLAFMNYDMARRLMLLLVLGGAVAPVLAAAAGGEANLEWGMMTVELFGGLALFLFGMMQMEEGLKAVAGERMKNILATLTTNRYMGVFTGALVTAVIQSSSVTTVLVVGFISAGLMSLAQSVGVIMGANIGTTITAQIVAFKITKAALLLIAVGFAMLFLSKDERTRHYGGMTMGLGMIFFGMHVMGEAMQPLRTFEPFLDLMKSMDNPLIGVLVATVFTAIIQSSSASTGIVIVMAGQGFISLEAGIALAFGANIGTCATALLAVIGKPREAVRAAIVHLSFNVFGVMIWLPFIGFIADFVTAISPAYPDLAGTARLAAETPRQIANAHTFFNVANTLIFIWFTSQFARWAEWLVPDKPMEEEGIIVRAKYLEEALLSTPSLALDRVRMEILHMGETVNAMMTRIMPAILGGNHESLEEVRRMDDAVDILHAEIVAYLGKIAKQPLSEGEMQEFLRLIDAASNLENIGDIIETNMVVLGHDRINDGLKVSAPTQEVLNGFQAAIIKAVGAAVQAVSQRNEIAAQVVIGMKDEITRIAEIKKIALFHGLAWFALPALTHAASGAAEVSRPPLTDHWVGYAALVIFLVAYLIVMAEEFTHLRKSKPVILAAGILWLLVAIAYHNTPAAATVAPALRHNVMEYAELFLFLLSAMTYINAMEERLVFDALRSWLIRKGFGYRRLFWVTGWLAFFISPVADNMTTALLMGAVLLAVGVGKPRFVGLGCINIVVAANAGGAFSPFGDITTLMVWQKGLITPQGPVDFWSFFLLFIPSVVNFVVPALAMHFAIPDEKPLASDDRVRMRRGAKRIIFLFAVTLATAVSFHSFFHLPPMLGMMTGLAYLQFFGYFLKKTHRPTLDMRDANLDIGQVGDVVPFDIFRKIARAEWDTLLFFYGVILCVGALGFIGYLGMLSQVLYVDLGPTLANILIGLMSAILDNIPIMFAVLSMNPDMSMGQWLLISLTAGVGGSLLSIGSAAGVALMGQARGQYTFFLHLRWTWAIALGYAASIAVHLFINQSVL